MACIMMKLVVIEYTLHCLIQMHKNMDTPGNGQYCLNNKLLLLLSALQALTLQTPGRPPTFPQPPKSPYPPRKAPEDSKGRRSGLAPGRKLLFDDDEEGNKENLPPRSTPPPQQKEADEEELEEEEEELAADLRRLLVKLGHDIDQYQERICRDLDGLRKKLGIHQ
uniref:E4 protein n=1 Tax=Human papillomavirus TaxID=10566 RepID=A0A386H7D3_9PAPI|nr:MAG: E4 protein [Human papillomavirus]